jgi:hypothetical protein
MKKLFLQFSVLCLLMPLMAPTCGRSDEFDPAKGIDVYLVSESKSVNANVTSKNDPPFSKTYSVNLGDEFKSRAAGVDVSKLTAVFVEGFTVSFNTANCAKLSAYSVLVNFPIIGAETNTDCNAALDYTKSGSPFAIKVLGTNFAQAIKDNLPIIVTFTMKAKEDIPAGEGVSVSVSARATYKP